MNKYLKFWLEKKATNIGQNLIGRKPNLGSSANKEESFTLRAEIGKDLIRGEMKTLRDKSVVNQVCDYNRGVVKNLSTPKINQKDLTYNKKTN